MPSKPAERSGFDTEPDGGGPGSISQLRLIGEYVTRLAHDLKVDVDTLLPAECFDLIGGSGFGGYVARSISFTDNSVDPDLLPSCWVVLG